MLWTYLSSENSGEGHRKFLEFFRAFWKFIDSPKPIFLGWILLKKRVLAAKARPPKSSTRGAHPSILLPICCFSNKLTPKTPISMCGHQAQIPKFRKICKIFEMSIFEKNQSCLRGRQTVPIVRTYIIFIQIDALDLFEFWKLRRGSSEISGVF